MRPRNGSLACPLPLEIEVLVEDSGRRRMRCLPPSAKRACPLQIACSAQRLRALRRGGIPTSGRLRPQRVSQAGHPLRVKGDDEGVRIRTGSLTPQDRSREGRARPLRFRPGLAIRKILSVARRVSDGCLTLLAREASAVGSESRPFVFGTLIATGARGARSAPVQRRESRK